MIRASLLVEVMRQPPRSAALRERDWDVLVRQARRTGLLARLAHALSSQGVHEVPVASRRHLDVAVRLSSVQRQEVRREVALLQHALRPLDVPIVLMKGAAYVMAGSPAAEGRLFSDLDILVPRHRLAEVEALLMARGWATTHLSAYDQRYYREWMHELPPMVHIHRNTVLDVHHNILPQTARDRPDAALLLEASRPIDGEPALRVLAPADLVLHSMSHLFHNDDLGHALRDLSDLDLLLRDRLHDGDFWPALLDRAEQLRLTRPLRYGLRYSHAVLATPIPAHVLRHADRWAPSRPVASCMDALWSRALSPRHASCDDLLSPLARGALWVRAHWLRMPPPLLVRHLATKALRAHPPRQRRTPPAAADR